MFIVNWKARGSNEFRENKETYDVRASYFQNVMRRKEKLAEPRQSWSQEVNILLISSVKAVLTQICVNY